MLSFREKLAALSQKNNSRVCMGLDIEFEKLPKSVQSKNDPVFSFAKQIIDETHTLVCAYKPNSAFFEAHGEKGMRTLRKIIEYIPNEIPIILDAKRGDIGNTARLYAKAVFDDMGADAVTLHPYMGIDSIEPFLNYSNKGIFVLGLTSNPGAKDFQYLQIDGIPLYQKVAEKVAEWDSRYYNLGLVVGATRPESFDIIRKILPTQPLLIPGIGAQGGDIRAVVQATCAIPAALTLINASRSILYASVNEDFAVAAARAATALRDEINCIFSDYN